MKVRWRCFTIVHGLMAALFTCAALMFDRNCRAHRMDGVHGSVKPGERAVHYRGVGATGRCCCLYVDRRDRCGRRGDSQSRPERANASATLHVPILVVVVVALAIEGLVATFKAIHQDPSQLWYAAGLIAATATLLAAWGVFVHLNRSADELEPEAMAKAKREDAKIQ
uniref:hypothetical protein n=1 Tax=Paraburkholderia bannensis TaxID=765414 RepID=UPI0038BE0D0E